MIDQSKLASQSGVIDFQTFRSASYFPKGIEDPRNIPRERLRQLHGEDSTQNFTQVLSSIASRPSEKNIEDWSYDLSSSESDEEIEPVETSRYSILLQLVLC